MSADNNNHFMKREIRALQQEEPRPDAKAELILGLMREKRESKMSILRKATLPTLVSIAAIAGVFAVSQPRVMAATPDRVIKAMQDIKNYTIKSFHLEGTERHLQSKTTVSGSDRKTVYYDAQGNETKINPMAEIMVGDSPMKFGFKLDGHGDLKGMSKEDIDKMKAQFHINLDTPLAGAKGNIRVEMKKGPDGKEEKHYFVNGKEVDKLPEGVNLTGDNALRFDGGVRIEAKKGPDGQVEKHFFVNGKEVDKLPEGMDIHTSSLKNDVKIKITKGADGKEEKHYFVNGKEVDKLPESIAPMVKIGKDGKSGNMIMINGDEVKGSVKNINKTMAVVGKNGDKPMVMSSGQTSADYLVNLLKDTTKWTIEHGVTYNGQKLDKFTLKGPLSPIVLYVDPATALPKVLRFETPFQKDAIIEDVYEYGNQP